MDVIEAMKGRGSVRAFLEQPVKRETIEAILDAARWAPSGVNTQPWQVKVVTGTLKQSVSEAIISARYAGIEPHSDYHYYPKQWSEPYKARRVKCGIALYKALEIKREDTERRKEVWERNYRFFDAPVGLFFFIDDYLEKGSWMDVGMFLQNVMLAARGVGLETCSQAALAEYPDIVRQHLGVEESKQLICGMALGYADWDAPINQYRTEREDVSTFTEFYF